MRKKEIVVQMSIKRKEAEHLETIERFSGTAEAALKHLHDKYVEPGWLERFENKLIQDTEEWNVILQKRTDERRQKLHDIQ